MDPSVLDAFAARSLRVPMEDLLTARRPHPVRRARRNHERRKD